MGRLRAYATVAAASLAVTAGATAEYDHFMGKAAPGYEQCTNKYIEQAELLDRCEKRVPYGGGTKRMAVLAIGGIVTALVSAGLALNTIHKSGE